MSGIAMRVMRGADGETRHVPAPYLVTPAKPARGRKPRVAPDPFRTNGESAAEQLRLLLERAERIAEEIRAAQDDLKDVLSEAASRGYDTKSIREIMAIRLKDKEAHAEHQSILETYMISLGML